jgi:hypothetical protein
MKRSFSSFDIQPNSDKCVIWCKITTLPVLYQKSLAVHFGFPQPGVVFSDSFLKLANCMNLTVSSFSQAVVVGLSKAASGPSRFVIKGRGTCHLEY